MKRLKTTMMAAVVVIVATFIFIGIAFAQSQKSEPIKIGLIAAFSGPQAEIGPLIKGAVEMRLQESNYGIAGRKIELVVEDGAEDTSISLEKAKKLVEMDKVKIIIGPTTSSVALAVAPYLSQNKVIDIGMLHHPPQIAKMGVIVFPGTLESTGLITGWYASEKGHKGMTTIAADYVAGKQFVGGARDGFKAKGGTLLKAQWAPIGTLDFGPYLSAIDKNADVLVVWTTSGDLLRLVKQIKEFGIKMPFLISPASTLRPDNLKELGKDILGVGGGAEYTSMIDSAVNKKFVSNYKAKFGKRPDKNSACGYAAAAIALAGLQGTKGEPTYEKMRQAIIDSKFEIPHGPLSFTPDGIAVTNRYLCEARVIDGEYDWWPIRTYTNVRP
jgi:branched-chain amino acid transport system substrate-binding protein